MYEQFEYLKPQSTSELLSFLEEDKALLYAGGTDILVMMRDQKLSAKRIVDTKGIPEYHTIKEMNDVIRIGCAVTHTEIANNHLIRKWASSLAEGVSTIGSVQIRNKATLVGNVQTASPSGDGYNAAWGLGGQVVLKSHNGTRKVPLDQYVFAPRHTDLKKGEFIEAIEISKREWTFQRFFKVGRRNALAISVVNGLVALEINEGKIKDARISVGAVGPTPLRIETAESALKGNILTLKLAESIAEIVQHSVQPISDIRASAEYRAYMAGVMIKRTLLASLEERK